MIKHVLPSSFGFGEAVAARVKVSSRGLRGNDLDAFVKRAGVDFLPDLEQIRPGEVPIHWLAVGATEAYGANRNGDGFDEADCLARHDTFRKFGHYYHDHVNKDPRKNYGRLVKTAYHAPMKRIELLVALSGTEEAARRNGGLVATRDLEKLARGEELAGSMACSTSPDTPVLTDSGYKRIADVAVGDLVHTHAGRWRRVTSLNRRRYTGDVLTIALEGLPIPLELTADHPMHGKVLQNYPAMLAGRRSEERKAGSQRPVGQWKAEVEIDGAAPFSWVHVDHLDRDDRIECRPVLVSPPGAVLDDPALCALMGIYTAEGSIGYSGGNPNIVAFTIHADDWAVAGIPALVANLWAGVNTTLRPKKNCKVAFTLEVYSAELARFMLRFVGSGFDKKRIPLELFGASDECKLAFLGRWLDGDGWTDIKGLHWSSGNLGLVLQGRDLLLSIGIASSIYAIRHQDCETSGYGGSGTEYTLNVSNYDDSRLAAWSAKVAANTHSLNPSDRAKPTTLYPVGNTFAYRIREVARTSVADIETYNVEVEDDESYGLLGMTSHNCRVAHDVCDHCNNHARNRDEYCDDRPVKLASGRLVPACSGFGCKNGLTKVGADGRMQFVHNPDCVWFDFSGVYRNADRIAMGMGVLEKAASASVIGGAAMAESLGITAPTSVLAGGSRFFKLAVEMAAAERDHGRWAAYDGGLAATKVAAVPDAPAASVFRALADAGAVLGVHDWLTVVHSKEAAASAAGEVQARLPGVFGRMCGEDAVGDAASTRYAPSPDLPPVRLREWAGKQAAALAVTRDLTAERATRASLRGEPVPAVMTKAAGCDHGGAESLAREYARYQLAFLAVQPAEQLRDTVGLLVRRNMLA